MRAPTDMPRRRRRTSGRGRVLLIVAAVVIFLLITSLRGVAGFYTDFLWFQNLGLSQVWGGILEAKIVLGVVFTLIFFVMCFVNLTVADRTAPKFRPAGPEDEMLARYHDLVDRRAWVVRAAVSLVFGLITGVGVSSEWNKWILFTHAQSFGVNDATFNTDVGFYVFRLPFYQAVTQWLFAALIIILIITLVSDYLNGGIRLQTPMQRVTPQVKAHLSVLLAVLALVKAVDYWLARYQLTFSTRGTVNGATYTAVHAELPALNLLIFIALLSAGLFVYNIWRRGWVLPMMAVGPVGAGGAGGRDGLPGVRAALPGAAVGVEQGSAVHLAQHRRHSPGHRVERGREPAVRLQLRRGHRPRRPSRPTRGRSATSACSTPRS